MRTHLVPDARRIAGFKPASSKRSVVFFFPAQRDLSHLSGGPSGIRLEAAKLFPNDGTTVAVIDTNAKRLANATSILGEGAVTLSVYLRDPTQIHKAIGDVVETPERININFSNAVAGSTVTFPGCDGVEDEAGSGGDERVRDFRARSLDPCLSAACLSTQWLQM